MHKGRSYPWDWYYWSTECFFYPGYVPWQMATVVSLGQPVPWFNVGNLVQQSYNANHFGDATQVSWNWYPDLPDDPFNYFVLSVEQESFSGVVYAVWKLTYTEITVKGVAYYFQPAPLYSCGIPVAPWWSLHDPTSARDGPYLGFRPALWSEIRTQPHA